MIVNCWQRILLVFELPTPRQLCSNELPRPLEKVPDESYNSLSVDFSNTARAQRGVINKQPGNAFGAVTKIRPMQKYRDNYSTASGAVTTNVVYNGITFGSGTSVGYRTPQYCYSGAVPRY